MRRRAARPLPSRRRRGLEPAERELVVRDRDVEQVQCRRDKGAHRQALARLRIGELVKGRRGAGLADYPLLAFVAPLDDRAGQLPGTPFMKIAGPVATGTPPSAAAVTVTSAGSGCADDSSRIGELARVTPLLKFPAGAGHREPPHRVGEEASPDHGDSRDRSTTEPIFHGQA